MYQSRAWNQSAQRNVTEDQRRIIIGRLYNREKKHPHGRSDRIFSEGQNDTPKSTAENIAEKVGISDRTVKRYGKDADVTNMTVEQNNNGLEESDGGENAESVTNGTNKG